MGISLRDLDHVILSHGHLDHTGGLVPLVSHLTEAKINRISHKIPELIVHPRCFYPKPKSLMPNTGTKESSNAAEKIHCLCGLLKKILKKSD